MKGTTPTNSTHKVLFFDDRHYAAQGAQKLLVRLAVFAKECGLDVTVGSTRDGALLDLARVNGVPVVELGVPKDLDQFEGALTAGLMAKVRSARALIVQNISLARQIRAAEYEIVWAAAMRPMLSLMATALLPRVRLVWQLMGSGYFLGFSEMASLMATRIVVIAENLRPSIGVLHDWFWVKGKVRVVQTGLPMPVDQDFDRRLFCETLGVSPDADDLVWVISIGAHIAEKGHLDVVRAVEAMPVETRSQVFLLLGGPPLKGDYHDELIRASENADARISVHGWIDNVDAWLRAADIYVVASQREGMPLTLIEAMQRGVTAVGYPVGGIPELIRDGETGLLVEQGSIPDLSAALGRLVQERDVARELATRGRRLVLAENTEDSMRKKFESVVKELFPDLGAAKSR